jgi:hypothetical protein
VDFHPFNRGRYALSGLTSREDIVRIFTWSGDEPRLFGPVQIGARRFSRPVVAIPLAGDRLCAALL